MSNNVRTRSYYLYGYSMHTPVQSILFDLETARTLGLEKTILLEYLYRKYTLGNEMPSISGQIIFDRMWYEASIEVIASTLPFFDEATIQRLWDELVSDGLLHVIPGTINNGNTLYAIDFDALDTKLNDAEQD